MCSIMGYLGKTLTKEDLKPFFDRTVSRGPDMQRFVTTEGAVLGFVYGLTSLYDAMTGASAMTHFFFQISPFGTIVLCVVIRTLVGFLTGIIFNAVKKFDKKKFICYYVGGLAAPMLNTIMFMGFIVLFFYKTEFVQNLAAKVGAVNPLMFIILVVGIQGMLEWLGGIIIGGSVAKAVAYGLKRD